MRWKRIRRMASLAFLIAVLGWVGCRGNDRPDPPAPPDLVTVSLQISRFTTSTLSDARADEILAGKSTILQTNDGPGDVACNVVFTRDGPVTVFNNGNGMINSRADFLAINNLPGNVKVVNQINFCGGLAPNIIGCAPVPGTSRLVVRFTPSQEDILWVHEFGHNKNLGHRNGDNLVMNPIIGQTKRRINQTECDAYRQ